MIKVKATVQFVKLAYKLISSEKLQELVDWLILNPQAGVIISGTGGIRKLRWQTGKDNKGKSGGIRVLYYYENSTLVVLLIMLYRKSDKENIDAKEKACLKKMLPELLRDYI